MSYFCTPMPTELEPPMLGLLRSRLFNDFFPADYASLQKVSDNNSASMLKGIGEEAYIALRAEMARHLLDKPKIAALLTESGIAQQTADDFVASHIGVNELAVNHGVKPRNAQLQANVSRLVESTGGDLVARLNMPRGADQKEVILFSATMLRPWPGEALPWVVEALVRKTFVADRLSYKPEEGWGHPTEPKSLISVAAVRGGAPKQVL